MMSVLRTTSEQIGFPKSATIERALADSFIHAACLFSVHPAHLTLHVWATVLFNTPSSSKCVPFSRYGNASEAVLPTMKIRTAFTHGSSMIYLSIIFTGWCIRSNAHLQVGALDHRLPIYTLLCCTMGRSTDGKQVKY